MKKFFELLSKNKSLYILGAICLALIFLIGFVKGDVDILDTKFFYLKSEIQILFASIGEEGRAVYQKINIIDFIFIAAYKLFFIGMYFAFFKEIANTLIAIPILLSLVDAIETSIIFYLLQIYPETVAGLEFALVFLTPLKWLLALSSLLIIVNGYFVNLYIKSQKK